MSEQLLNIVRQRQVIHLREVNRDIGIEALSIKDFAELQRQALVEYKREQLQTWTTNADLIPAELREQWIRDAFLRFEKLSAADLPQKTNADGRVQDYVSWWLNSTASGQLHAAWLAMRKYPGQEHMTLKDADDIFTAAASEMNSVVDAVADMSMPKRDPEQPEGNLTRRQRKMLSRRNGRR